MLGLLATHPEHTGRAHRKSAVSSRWMAAFFQTVCWVHVHIRVCLLVNVHGDARSRQSLSSMALWFIFGTESLASPEACRFG